MSIFQKARWLLPGLLIMGLFFSIRLLPMEQWIQVLMKWIDQLGFWGPLIFGLIYVLATILMVPASALTIAVGAMFGLLTATITVSLASTTGAAFAFLIARYLARDRFSQQLKQHPKFAAVDQAIGREGWKIVALLRLSPLVPFNLQNYLYGLTAIRFWPYVFTSWAAMLPGTFMYVYLGYIGRASLESVSQDVQHGPLQWTMLVMGLLATAAVLWYVTRLAHRAIQKRVGIEKTEYFNNSS